MQRERNSTGELSVRFLPMFICIMLLTIGWKEITEPIRLKAWAEMPMPTRPCILSAHSAFKVFADYADQVNYRIPSHSLQKKHLVHPEKSLKNNLSLY